MTKSRAFGRCAELFAFVLVMCALLVSCAFNPKLEVEGKKQDFSAMSRAELEKYLTVGKYKGMQITLNGRTKEAAVWDAILKNCEVHEYPSEHVYYYKNQREAEYSYYAELAGVSYKEMLKQLGESESTILQEAKKLTKKDIAYAIIVKIEKISLTEEEKTNYFDMYVDKYVEEYGYTKEHVVKEMKELIYSSMLYDKTTEFLILNNSFKD